MNQDILFFFDKHPEALPLYEKLEEQLLSKWEDIQIKVQKTQISFYQKRMFACVSFAKVRKSSLCPPTFITVTFGLEHKVDSPRIDIATEPYPHRWTHHILISDPAEIDQELLDWIEEAQAFAAQKR